MAGKAKTEIACSLSWFKSWSEDQKKEFAEILIQAENGELFDDTSLDTLMNQMSLSQVHKESPSIFECQLKIFSKWYQCWSPGDRSELSIQLHVLDPAFINFVNDRLR